MKRLWLALGAAIVGFSPLAAHAQNADWQGPYVGVSLNGATYDSSGTDVDGYNDTGEVVEANGDGWGAGVLAGYDWRFGQWVLGGVVDAQFVDGEGEGASTFFGGDTIYTTQVDNIMTLRARGGWVFGESFLLYATGGVGLLSTEFAVNDSSTLIGAGLLNGSTDESETVAVYGAGIEYRVTPNSTLGFDYLHADGDDVTVNATCTTCGGDQFRFNFEQDYDFYRFSWNWSF